MSEEGEEHRDYPEREWRDAEWVEQLVARCEAQGFDVKVGSGVEIDFGNGSHAEVWPDSLVFWADSRVDADVLVACSVAGVTLHLLLAGLDR